MKLRLKKKMARITAFLIDDGVLLLGKLQRGTFYTNDFLAGFSSQVIRKRDIGRILFQNRKSFEKCRELHPDYLAPLPRREQPKSLIVINGKTILNSFIMEFETRIYETMGMFPRNIESGLLGTKAKIYRQLPYPVERVDIKLDVNPLPVPTDEQPMDFSWLDNIVKKLAEISSIPQELLFGIPPMMHSASGRAVIIPDTDLLEDAINLNLSEDFIRDHGLKEYIKDSARNPSVFVDDTRKVEP